MKKQILTGVLCVAACLVVSGCAHKVTFSCGEYKSDAKELSLQIQDGEMALLDEFDSLATVDFTGSTNYAEIMEWARNHPNVNVIYTIFMPDGSQVSPNVEYLDITSYQAGDLDALEKLMHYMPNLKTLEMGDSNGNFTALDAHYMQSVFPGVKVNYSLVIAGKTYTGNETSLDFTAFTEADAQEALSLLSEFINVKNIKLGSESTTKLSLDTIVALGKACPNAVLDYAMNAYGWDINLSDEHLNLSQTPVGDDGALVRKILPVMRNCTVLDMDSSGVTSEKMAVIRDENPAVKVIWRIWFGDRYSVRTDVKTILASNPDWGGHLKTEVIADLKYCTDVENLDLGHNTSLVDIDFLNYMPHIKVLILMGASYMDASPLANLQELEYFEMQTNEYIIDISPVGQCKNLKHLNICYMWEVKDMSALMDLDLERLWIGCYTPIPESQIAEYQSRHPDCQINTTTDDPVLEGWRYIVSTGGYGEDILHPWYIKVREIFDYSYDDPQHGYSYYYNDPLYQTRSDY